MGPFDERVREWRVPSGVVKWERGAKETHRLASSWPDEWIDQVELNEQWAQQELAWKPNFNVLHWISYYLRHV